MHTAFVFLEDGDEKETKLTYGELYRDCTKMAAVLSEKECLQKTALLLFPPGIEYVKAFLACQAAGVIAVPIYPPRSSKHADRLQHILKDCQASLILTTDKYRTKLESFSEEVIQECDILTVQEMESGNKSQFNFEACQSTDNVAFIQYTSGSTGNPKGVVVTNKNLLANEAQIKGAVQQTKESVIVSWLPMYHDMGLIGNILHNVYIGSKCVFFAPVHFLQKPLRWLRAVTKYRATLSGAPNFAFDLLNQIDITDEQLDLSSLEVAFNGSEKVRKDTLEAFYEKFKTVGLKRGAIYPCYGLAEATLMVSGKNKGEVFQTITTTEAQVKAGKLVAAEEGAIHFVSAGKVRAGIEVIIRDDNGNNCNGNEIGEICIHGDNVTSSYWGGRSPESFFKQDGKLFLRTGDLGALANNEIYITGRKKEIIILNGVNYYPYDIEREVAQAHHGLVVNGCAAFSVENGTKEELIIVTEIERTYYREFNPNEVFDAINDRLGAQLGFLPDDIVVIKPMNLPKTSSGKIQRSSCANHYTSGTFEPICTQKGLGVVSKHTAKKKEDHPLSTFEEIIEDILGRTVSLEEYDSIHEVGLDSLRFMEFATVLEKKFQVAIPIENLYEDLNFKDLLKLLNSYKEADAPETSREVSMNQEALWLGSQNGLTENTIGFSFTLTGDVTTERLVESLTVALNHLNWESINFNWKAGELGTTQNKDLFETIVLDSEDNLEIEALQSWDLESDTLVRLVYVKQEKTIVFLCHHIISDGWSLATLFEVWTHVLAGNELEAIKPSYQAFIQEEVQTLNDQELVTGAQNYILQNLDASSLNAFTESSKGASIWHQIPVELDKEQVGSLAKNLGVTPYLLLLGAYHFALTALTEAERICTVTPVSRRTTRSREHLFGYLVNLAYIGSQAQKEDTAEEYFNRLQKEYRKALQYQNVPYATLLRDLQLSEEQKTALGKYYFAFQSFENNRFLELFSGEEKSLAKWSGGEIKSGNPLLLNGNFPLELELFEWATSIGGTIKFNTSIFSSEFAISVLQSMHQFVELLGECASLNELEKSIQYSSLATVDGEELSELNTHFLDQWSESVRKFPDALALESNALQFSYRELDVQSTKQAIALKQAFDLQKNETVLLVNERKAENIVAMLALMKSGGVYAPIEASTPKERIARIAEISGARYIIGAIEENIPSLQVIDIDNCEETGQSLDLAWRSKYAYIIHTSGSTGVPKGVKITQEALVNLNETMCRTYDLMSTDRLLQFAPLSFDMSVEEIFPILSCGGTLVIRPEHVHENLYGFNNYCEENNITVLNLPTSFWNELTQLDTFTTTVRLVAVGGEVMQAQFAEKWLNKFGKTCQLFNAYGPTEYTVNAAIQEITISNHHAITIGKPILNTTVTVRNEHGIVLPKGISGEITLTGKGMADGYTTDQKTSAFVEVEGQRLYKTGDLGYINTAGEICVIGRKDDQVKVRGFRVELGEINHQIIDLDEITNAWTCIHEDNIYAFVATSRKEWTEAAIQRELRERIPAYMIPVGIVLMEQLPVTLRGKIDQKQLMALVANQQQPIEPPTTELEGRLHELWTEVLDHKTIGINTDFFQAGGHSIKAIKLLSRIESELSTRIDLKHFYETPTIKQQAAYIETLNWVDNAPACEEQDELII